ncbi:histone deacetylase Ecym_3465 [Eremothecium cymbalariae DBVPG|uniref:histone deacetylase n=1 Tax=Eremothecium cymbalariae (strain CBS 270.75 / DBVPG 7215 / KCTC 17166 / NRRL Y-17582) TaxID=931890 RepID=G8JS29_ERECY|nr:Hypothetical protein Ecym_3465 [Eremothecium cymbalariae DBVPG\
MVKFVISSSVYQAQISDLLPSNDNCKAQLIYSLLNSYDVFKYFDKVIKVPYASRKDLARFHSKQYLDVALDPRFNKDTEESEDWEYLPQLVNRYYEVHEDVSKGDVWYESKSDLYKKYISYINAADYDDFGEDFNDGESFEPDSLVRFGLVDDCFPMDYLPMYIHTIAGSTLSLVRELSIKGEPTIAINWDGGRHHAFKSRASGFCYINDIVLLIQELRKNGYSRVSYVDFDLHHGDAVESAFQYSRNVQTCSLHLFEAGFFPGTGSFKNCRETNVVNIPLFHGLDDESLDEIVDNILIPCVNKHDPEVLVIQCGADGLSGDKYKEWQLTIHGLTRNILKLVDIHSYKKVVLLGGGGYNPTLQSRFYTYVTVCLLKYHKGIPSLISDSEDEHIIEHHLIDFYRKEAYKFWYYEYEGLGSKKLINYNNKETLRELKVLFGSTDVLS